MTIDTILDGLTASPRKEKTSYIPTMEDYAIELEELSDTLAAVTTNKLVDKNLAMRVDNVVKGYLSDIISIEEFTNEPSATNVGHISYYLKEEILGKRRALVKEAKVILHIIDTYGTSLYRFSMFVSVLDNFIIKDSAVEQFNKLLSNDTILIDTNPPLPYSAAPLYELVDPKLAQYVGDIGPLIEELGSSDNAQAIAFLLKYTAMDKPEPQDMVNDILSTSFDTTASDSMSLNTVANIFNRTYGYEDIRTITTIYKVKISAVSKALARIIEVQCAYEADSFETLTIISAQKMFLEIKEVSQLFLKVNDVVRLLGKILVNNLAAVPTSD